MQRNKRTKDFDLSIHIKNEKFLQTPTAGQRNWLLHRTLSEWSNDLRALDAVASEFAHGGTAVAIDDREQAELTQQEIMEDWQFPIMKAMADVVSASHGDVLEIGYGRGIASRYLQEQGLRSHTLVECNGSIVDDYNIWRATLPDRDIRMIYSLWQDAAPQFDSYDGVFFHTYPLSQDELVENVIESTTFAEHFFKTAASVLRPGGVFTYMTNEIDSFSREHQRLLLRDFRSITLQVVRGLKIPEDVTDSWWAPSMVVVRAEK